MGKFTEGPWKYDDFYLLIESKDGTAIAAVGALSNHEANARLIAASPDLLEACKAVLAWAITPIEEDEGGFEHLAETVVPMVEAAIKKAEGDFNHE